MDDSSICPLLLLMREEKEELSEYHDHVFIEMRHWLFMTAQSAVISACARLITVYIREMGDFRVFLTHGKRVSLTVMGLYLL